MEVLRLSKRPQQVTQKHDATSWQVSIILIKCKLHRLLIIATWRAIVAAQLPVSLSVQMKSHCCCTATSVTVSTDEEPLLLHSYQRHCQYRWRAIVAAQLPVSLSVQMSHCCCTATSVTVSTDVRTQMSVPERIVSDHLQKEICQVLEESVSAVKWNVCFMMSLNTVNAGGLCVKPWIALQGITSFCFC